MRIQISQSVLTVSVTGFYEPIHAAQSSALHGSPPLIGVNAVLGGKEGHAEGGEVELMRSTGEGKHQQVSNIEASRDTHQAEAGPELARLQQVASERKRHLPN